MFNYGVDGDILLRFERIINIDTDHSLSPLFKLGHFLPWELISIASDMHSAIIIDNELCVFISPPVNFKPLLLVTNRLTSLDLLLGQG